jgi:hypothetical protein
MRTFLLPFAGFLTPTFPQESAASLSPTTRPESRGAAGVAGTVGGSLRPEPPTETPDLVKPNILAYLQWSNTHAEEKRPEWRSN